MDESTGKGSTQGGGNYSYALDWLKNQLDEAVKEDPTKPIFVFSIIQLKIHFMYQMNGMVLD